MLCIGAGIREPEARRLTVRVGLGWTGIKVFASMLAHEDPRPASKRAFFG